MSHSSDNFSQTAAINIQLDAIMTVKSVGTFLVILVILATPPLPSQRMLRKIAEGEWENKGRIRKCHFEEQSSYVAIIWKGFFTQSQVLLSSIVLN